MRGAIKMESYDFSGYVTKNDILCSDGRVIRSGAFKHNDGQKVPLVWQHTHDKPENVLGHAVLENREDGVYAYGKFNDTSIAENAKALVRHGDITALSIYANKLKQQGSDVIHGTIREVSLVLAGANPGAMIDNVMMHGDEMDDIAVIYTGLPVDPESGELMHEDKDEDKDESESKGDEKVNKEETVQEVFDSMNEKQKNVVYAMMADVMDENAAVEHADYDEGEDFMRNVFDQTEEFEGNSNELTHSDMEAIIDDAKRSGSLKESFMMHAEQNYGIENIDYLFPDARTIASQPEFIKRDDDWVSEVLRDTHHTPFSRIKTIFADVTAEEARALGYVKGNMKKEEIIKLLKRVTTPTTIYKKQKLDRDDVIDITDMNVIVWLKAEMRMMLNEEIARAVLIGDGRDIESDDKINQSNIRPVALDDDMYAHKVEVDLDTDDVAPAEALVEAIIRARKHYKGAGNPKFYTTTDTLNDMLLSKDKLGRRLYETEAALASALRVSKIVEVPVMEGQTRKGEDDVERELLGIIVNLKDYSIGADKGGEINMFDDFDIDFNQHKYLMETRMSGALTKPKAALVIEKKPSTTEPETRTFGYVESDDEE